MNEFLASLGIREQGHTTAKGAYVIDTTESQLNKYYSLLDKSDELETNDDTTLITDLGMSITFFNDMYRISLISDFESDRYQLIIERI